jgi:hypothetical protein
MSGNLQDIVPQVAVDIEGKEVTIALICSDAYAARVLFEDVVAKITSGASLKLQLRAELRPEEVKS